VRAHADFIAVGRVLLGAALCATAPALAAAAPRLVIVERAIDFGTIPPYEVSAREVVARNAGDAPLVLRRLRATLEVARARAQADTIAPGSETRILVALKPIEPTPTTRDTIDTKVLFDTNDPAAATVVLLVHAIVAPRFEADLSTREAGSFRASAAPSFDIPIRFRADGGLRFQSVGAIPAFVRVAARPGADSLETIVTVGFAPEAPRGPFEGQVIVAVRGERADTLRVGLLGEVVGRWRVAPFPFNTARYKFTRRQPPVIRCDRTVEKPARIVSATTDLAGYEVKVETVTEGRAYRIYVVSNSDWKPGRWNGTIRITTDDPNERVISVPASFLVEK